MVRDRNEVVVGLDGSPSARAALHWAVRYARFTFTDLRAVHDLPCTVDASLAWAAAVAGIAGPVPTEPDKTLMRVTGRMFEAVSPETG